MKTEKIIMRKEDWIYIGIIIILVIGNFVELVIINNILKS